MLRTSIIILLFSLMIVFPAYADIFDAAKRGDTTTVQAFLNAGADVNARDKAGWTVLIWAAEHGYIDIVKMLLDSGANVDLRNYRGSALIRAALKGHKNIVQALLDKGATVNATRNGNISALMDAAYAGHTDIVQLLVDKGADVNMKTTKYGLTALMWATSNNHIETVQILLKNGADVNAEDNKGETALMWAERQGHTEIVEVLKKPEKLKPVDTKQERKLLKEKAKKKALNKEQIDMMEINADFFESMKAFRLKVGSLARKRKNNCLKAFGNEQFCNCLNDNLPMAINFVGYIQLITSTKDEIGYKSLLTEDKEFVDKVIRARDQCVDKIQ